MLKCIDVGPSAGYKAGIRPAPEMYQDCCSPLPWCWVLLGLGAAVLTTGPVHLGQLAPAQHPSSVVNCNSLADLAPYKTPTWRQQHIGLTCLIPALGLVTNWHQPGPQGS